MTLTPIICPGCKAQLKVAAGEKYTSCSYCGTQIRIDDGVQRSEHVYKEVDEARIRESEMNHELNLKKMEIEAKERAEKRMLMKIAYAIALGLFVIGLIAGFFNFFAGMLICYLGVGIALFVTVIYFNNSRRGT